MRRQLVDITRYKYYMFMRHTSIAKHYPEANV